MLATLAEVKAKLGISGSADDTYLTDRINFLSEVIETYCRTSFTPRTIEETFYADDWDTRRTNAITTFFYPIISVADVDYDSNPGPATNLPLGNLKIHKPTGTLFFKETPFIWNDDLVITYVAGYTSVPLPVLEVFYNLIGEAYNRKSSGVDYSYGNNVQSVAVPGTISIAYDYTLTNNERGSTFGTIIGDYANVLDAYRSHRAVLGGGKLEFVEEIP